MKLIAPARDKVADPGGLAASIVASFAQITPGRSQNDATSTIECIDFSQSFRSAVTTKPRKIRLNWKKLVEGIPELVLTGAGVTQMWLVPFAALYPWNMVWALTRFEIAPDHGAAMYALWSALPNRRSFTEAEAMDVVNRFRADHSV